MRQKCFFLQGRGPSFSSSSSPSHTLSMEQLSAEQLALWWSDSEGEIKPPSTHTPSPSLKPFNNPTLKPVRRGPTYSPLWDRPDRGPEHTTSQLSCSSRGYNNIDIQISILICSQAWQNFVKTVYSLYLQCWRKLQRFWYLKMLSKNLNSSSQFPPEPNAC